MADDKSKGFYSVRAHRGLGPTVTCAEEDVAGRGMPRHDADPLGVALQHHHGL